MDEPDDDLDGCRGVLNGCAMAVIFWMVFGMLVAYIVSYPK